jgi:hypothetical protein
MANIDPPQPLYIFVSKLLLIALWRRICGSFRPIRNPPNTPLRIVAPESAGASGAFAIRIASAEGHAGGGDGPAVRARAHAARGTRRDALSVARVGRAARADGAAESARGRVVRALSSNKHSSDDGAFICSDIFVQIYLFRYICSDMCSCDQNGRATDTAAVVHNPEVPPNTPSKRAPHTSESVNLDLQVGNQFLELQQLAA